MEPVPSPASFEKIPLATPFFILMKKLPHTPPVTEAGEKAPLKMERKDGGNKVDIQMTTIPSARKM